MIEGIFEVYYLHILFYIPIANSAYMCSIEIMLDLNERITTKSHVFCACIIIFNTKLSVITCGFFNQ